MQLSALFPCSLYTVLFPTHHYLENTTVLWLSKKIWKQPLHHLQHTVCHHETSVDIVANSFCAVSSSVPSCCFHSDKHGAPTTQILTANQLTKSSTCHIRHRWTMGQKVRKDLRIGKWAGKRERLRESPIFLSMVFIKASSLIASVKVTGSFMSTWRVPALVCVARQW